jgi:predicted cobalt transporter CbtA
MKIGLRQILLGIAVVLFVLAVFSDTNYADLIAWGLAAFAAAFLVDELGVGDRFGSRR